MLRLFLLVVTLSVGFPACAKPAQGPVIFADPYIREVLDSQVKVWTLAKENAPTVIYADSATLAHRIANGEKADLFISLDEEIVDQLDKDGLVKAGSRRAYLGNRIVLFGSTVGSTSSRFGLQLVGTSSLLGLVERGRLPGPIAMPNPNALLAGRDAQKILEHFGIWDILSDRLVFTSTEQEAIEMVNSGRAKFGLSYRSTFEAFETAMPDDQVQLISGADTNGSVPITYPMVELVSSTHDKTLELKDFLLTFATSTSHLFTHE